MDGALTGGTGEGASLSDVGAKGALDWMSEWVLRNYPPMPEWCSVCGRRLTPLDTWVHSSSGREVLCSGCYEWFTRVLVELPTGAGARVEALPHPLPSRRYRPAPVGWGRW